MHITRCDLVAFLRPILLYYTSHLSPFAVMDLNAHSSPLVFMPERAGGEASVTRVSASGLWNCTSHDQDSEQIHGLGEPWEYVQLPGSKIDTATSPGPDEEDGNPAFLPETNGIRPPEPDESETNVYGVINATAKAHDRWLLPALKRSAPVITQRPHKPGGTTPERISYYRSLKDRS